MCGVGLIYSKNSLPIHQRALDEFIKPLHRRGPDKLVITHVQNRYCMVNSILSIKGNSWPYQDNSERTVFRTTPDELDTVFSFNGEIYDWHTYTNSDISIDTDHVQDLVRRNEYSDLYNDYSGFFSFIQLSHVNGYPFVTYGTDTLGEKSLFVYSDSDFLVICSTITSIVRFLVAQGISPVANKHALSRYFLTRHYLFLGDSPFSGISKIEGGKVFSVDIPQNLRRCIYDAALNLQPEYKHELDLLDVIENEAYSDSINHKSAFILSGGIDSSLTARVASQLPGYHSSKRLFVTLTFGERDLTALQARQQAQSIGISEFLEIPVTVESYRESLDTFYSDYYMPACTHSFISNNILCRELSNNGVRLLYGGEGADELFQGYEAYKKMFDMSELPVGSSSPYSRIANSNLFGTPQYYSKLDDDEYIIRYLDRYRNLGLHPDFSGFLLDATLQLQSTGNLCSDITGSHHAIESRSPFVHIRNLKRLPQSIDTFNKQRTCKPILRQLFLSSYDHTFLKPKQGYSGFPNEAASQLLPSLKFPLCSDLLSVNLSNRLDDIDRSFEWKLYNMELFLERCL